MAEYIERKKAIDLFYPVDSEHDGSDGCTIVCKSGNFSSAEIETMLSELPTADVAPVRRGRWIPYGNGRYYCSECNHTIAFNPAFLAKHRYCWACGAFMDLEDEA